MSIKCDLLPIVSLQLAPNITEMQNKKTTRVKYQFISLLIAGKQNFCFLIVKVTTASATHAVTYVDNLTVKKMTRYTEFHQAEPISKTNL